MSRRKQKKQKNTIGSTISLYGVDGIVEYASLVIFDEMKGVLLRRIFSSKQHNDAIKMIDAVFLEMAKYGSEILYQTEILDSPAFCQNCNGLLIGYWRYDIESMTKICSGCDGIPKTDCCADRIPESEFAKLSFDEKKRNLATNLRQRQRLLGTVQAELIDVLPDNAIIDCYITCSCCGGKEVREDQLNEIISQSNGTSMFFSLLDQKKVKIH